MKKIALIFLLLTGAVQAQDIQPATCNISGATITCPSGSLTPSSTTGTVTSVSVTTANGVSGSVATATTTPAITLTLGAITPSTVAIGAGSAITSSGPGGALASGAFAASGPCTAFGTTAGTCAQGGVITAGGPTGSTTVVPVITYNAAGQLTAVTTATVASAITSKVVASTRDLTTATGTQAVTGFGFTPSSCDVFGTVSGVTTLTYTTYNGHSDSTGVVNALYAGAATVAYTTANFIVAQDTVGSSFQTASISAYSNDTVTLSWTKTGTPTGTFSFSLRCFK